MIFMRILRSVLANPRMFLRLLRPHMIKKAWFFLINNSWDLRKFLQRSEELYIREEQYTKKFPEIIYRLISHYQLPISSKHSTLALPSDDEINLWISDLKKLSENISGHHDIIRISIIIPVYNKIRFTIACLHSIFVNAGRDDYEIIIADDHSTDQTPAVFQNRFTKVRYFRNETSQGFLKNCNAAAKKAQGRYIVFLNNDTLVCPGWLDELVQPLDENSALGLVGCKLLYPDGMLQDAGGIVFHDVGAWIYGRCTNPLRPQFNYLRDVDYCSGASIAVSLQLWKQLGGFDEQFAPAYYEDTDLAFQVRAAGYRVVYQPLAEVVHFEGITHGKSEDSGIKKYQVVNQQQFFDKWKHVLTRHGSYDPDSIPADRTVKGRILIIDALTPTPDKDSGSMDAFNYMKIMKKMGFHVTFVPENLIFFDDYTRDLQRMGVECVYLPFVNTSKEAVMRYAPEADIVMLCRVYVASHLVDLVRLYAPDARIIFDTVDLHFLREERRAELEGSSALLARAANIRTQELGIIRKVDATILRSRYEVEFLNELVPDARLFNIPIVREIPGLSDIPWEDRRDIVFIGGFTHPPNADAVQYFVSEVWPILRAGGFAERFLIVGSNVPDKVAALASGDIVIMGYVKDLADVFGKCRLSIAPLRYGAGMKGKVITSLSYGVPCVATKTAAEGTGLVHHKNILVSDDPYELAQMIQSLCVDKPLWEALSRAGLLYCEENFSMEEAEKIIGNVFSELLTGR